MMTTTGFTLFETAIGPCGIAWGPRGVVGLQLPEGAARDTRARIARRFPDGREASPPASVKRTIARIVALMNGRATDLSAVELDLDAVPDFHRRVYQAARAIPPGQTLSYGEIATRIGSPGAARAVGQALGRNPFPIVVPCHRVLAAGGRAGGFSANGGIGTKLRMLAIEGATAPRATPGGGSPRRPRRARADGLGFDPRAALAHLREADPALARLIDAAGPFRMQVSATQSVFVALAEAIVYQQLTAKAAATIFGRVQALASDPVEGLSPALIARTADEALRGAGLSRAKLLALRDLASRTAAGELPSLEDLHTLPDAEIVERLVQVRGIGRWTAEMLLMFRLGRPDVLPVDDYGIRKGFAVAFRKRELPSPRDVAKRGERWRPYRTAASWYLWRALELPPR